METSEAVPRGGVRAPDLAELLQDEGPFLTACLETRGNVEQAADLSDTKWRSLAPDDAPPAALENIEGFIPQAHLHGDGFIAIATADDLLHVEYGATPPRRQFVRSGPLPSLAPIIAWRQAAPAHLVVIADRTGADLDAYRYGRPEIHTISGGDEDPVRKVSPGGWSQRRFQQRAENTWEANADETAAQIERLAGLVEPKLIVVAGDVRALQLIREALPQNLLALVQEVGGGRSPDGSREALDEEIVQLIDVVAAQEATELLKSFEQERGQGDRAAEGAEATLRALAMSQVEVLLVDDDQDDGRTAWFGPDPAHVSLAPRALGDLGVEDPVEAPLIDVLVRSAILTGARIATVPREAGIREGIGAILRWS